MSAKSLYIDAISDKIDLGGRWIANWPPGSEIAVAMVGDIEDGGFVQRGHLSDADRSVPFSKDEVKDRPDGYDWATHGAVEVFAKVKGETSRVIPHVEGVGGDQDPVQQEERGGRPLRSSDAETH